MMVGVIADAGTYAPRRMRILAVETNTTDAASTYARDNHLRNAHGPTPTWSAMRRVDVDARLCEALTKPGGCENLQPGHVHDDPERHGILAMGTYIATRTNIVNRHTVH